MASSSSIGGGGFSITPQHGVNRSNQKQASNAAPAETPWATSDDSLNVNFAAGATAKSTEAKSTKAADAPAQTAKAAPQSRVANAPALLSMDEVSGIGFGLSTSDPGALQGINGILSVNAKGGFETLSGGFIKA